MIRRIVYVLILVSMSSAALVAQEFCASFRTVRPTLETMFSYHVENRELSPLIVKRSFRLYLDQFDPNRMYVLQREAEPFLALNRRRIQEVISEYHQDCFTHYHTLNHVLGRAIQRAQRIRAIQAEKLIDQWEQALSQEVYSRYATYPHTEKELGQRMFSYLVYDVRKQLEKRPDQVVTRECVTQMVQHRLKKLEEFERAYLEGSEHEISVHILKAFARSLDAHTGYYSPSEAEEMRSALHKQVLGVGVVVTERFDGVFITDVIEGSPAHRSGKVCVGDRLVSVDHLAVDTLSFEAVLDKMKGKEHSRMVLGVRRDENRGATCHVTLEREKISIDEERLSMSSEQFAGGVIGKLEVPAFYDNGKDISLDKDMKEALRALKREGELKGLVLDFRENCGGFLTQAVKVASLFVDGGLIVISKYADGEVSYSRDVDGRQYFNGPLVILISKASASAAEIVAQALQDYGVALIVGDKRSYGKGSMQYQTLTDETAQQFFKVTVGRYYTASGRSPQIQGVLSDIIIPTHFFPYNIGERYLQYPLANDHLNGDLFHSLMHIQQGSYRECATQIVPYLKPRDTQWRRMLPILQASSEQRLEKNAQFQYFLKRQQLPKSRQKEMSHTGKLEDVQLQEAVEIVKEMYLLHQTP